MKRHVFVLIIMLLAISFANADGNPAEEADHWEKVRQLDQMAVRFKAETGFTGYISHDISRMCFGYYQGKFTGIQITATADTASFRAAFDQILDRVLPYTFAKREQLTKSRITNNLGIIQTDYYQQVNGYRVEGIGRLTINYETGSNAFAIGNGTVELPDENVETIISEEKAEQIALLDMNEERYSISKAYDLFYSQEGSDSYHLAYLVVLTSIRGGDDDDYAYWIDAKTGYIQKKRVAPRIP